MQLAKTSLWTVNLGVGVAAWTDMSGTTAVQYPNLPIIWLHIEHPHTGPSGSWLIHKRHGSQRIGLVVISPTLYKHWRRSLRIASKTKRLHKITAAYFSLPITSRRCFVLDGTCWTSQNTTEPVSVRGRPCAQREPGPMQALILSEGKCFTAANY